MTKNVKLSLLLVGFFAAVVAAIVFITTSGSGPQTTANASNEGAAAPLVRDDSHHLSTAPDGRVTLVEFMDFECEACRAAYPTVEQLRQDYAGEVTFVARYFPLPGHVNSENAAVAVEAAAQQGQFEAMYHKMFETQPQWGDQQTSQADLFRTFAQDLGLDMATYDQTVADPATLDRVRQDMADGVALGVQGTPTFFLNGQMISPASLEEFSALIDAALAS
ncbi:DsbA family protein [Georgenia sp. Z1344]|uniref:DsbA family protein n=1 Tax=Georgenia sp. Z1344 TaxID=3416706 RepID=UPI003CEC23C5